MSGWLSCPICTHPLPVAAPPPDMDATGAVPPTPLLQSDAAQIVCPECRQSFDAAALVARHKSIGAISQLEEWQAQGLVPEATVERLLAFSIVNKYASELALGLVEPPPVRVAQRGLVDLYALLKRLDLMERNRAEPMRHALHVLRHAIERDRQRARLDAQYYGLDPDSIELSALTPIDDPRVMLHTRQRRNLLMQAYIEQVWDEGTLDDAGYERLRRETLGTLEYADALRIPTDPLNTTGVVSTGQYEYHRDRLPDGTQRTVISTFVMALVIFGVVVLSRTLPTGSRIGFFWAVSGASLSVATLVRYVLRLPDRAEAAWRLGTLGTPVAFYAALTGWLGLNMAGGATGAAVLTTLVSGGLAWLVGDRFLTSVAALSFVAGSGAIAALINAPPLYWGSWLVGAATLVLVVAYGIGRRLPHLALLVNPAYWVGIAAVPAVLIGWSGYLARADETANPVLALLWWQAALFYGLTCWFAPTPDARRTHAYSVGFSLSVALALTLLGHSQTGAALALSVCGILLGLAGSVCLRRIPTRWADEIGLPVVRVGGLMSAGGIVAAWAADGLRSGAMVGALFSLSVLLAITAWGLARTYDADLAGLAMIAALAVWAVIGGHYAMAAGALGLVAALVLRGRRLKPAAALWRTIYGTWALSLIMVVPVEKYPAQVWTVAAFAFVAALIRQRALLTSVGTTIALWAGIVGLVRDDHFSRADVGLFLAGAGVAALCVAGCGTTLRRWTIRGDVWALPLGVWGVTLGAGGAAIGLSLDKTAPTNNAQIASLTLVAALLATFLAQTGRLQGWDWLGTKLARRRTTDDWRGVLLPVLAGALCLWLANAILPTTNSGRMAALLGLSLIVLCIIYLAGSRYVGDGRAWRAAAAWVGVTATGATLFGRDLWLLALNFGLLAAIYVWAALGGVRVLRLFTLAAVYASLAYVALWVAAGVTNTRLLAALLLLPMLAAYAGQDITGARIEKYIAPQRARLRPLARRLDRDAIARLSAAMGVWAAGLYVVAALLALPGEGSLFVGAVFAVLATGLAYGSNTALAARWYALAICGGAGGLALGIPDDTPGGIALRLALIGGFGLVAACVLDRAADSERVAKTAVPVLLRAGLWLIAAAALLTVVVLPAYVDAEGKAAGLLAWLRMAAPVWIVAVVALVTLVGLQRFVGFKNPDARAWLAGLWPPKRVKAPKLVTLEDQPTQNVPLPFDRQLTAHIPLENQQTAHISVPKGEVTAAADSALEPDTPDPIVRLQDRPTTKLEHQITS